MAFYDALYDTHKIRKGIYSYLPNGKFRQGQETVAGAVAQFEMGDDFGSRSTLGRVAAGAIIAGPVGAIVAACSRRTPPGLCDDHVRLAATSLSWTRLARRVQPSRRSRVT